MVSPRGGAPLRFKVGDHVEALYNDSFEAGVVTELYWRHPHNGFVAPYQIKLLGPPQANLLIFCAADVDSSVRRAASPFETIHNQLQFEYGDFVEVMCAPNVPDGPSPQWMPGWVVKTFPTEPCESLAAPWAEMVDGEVMCRYAYQVRVAHFPWRDPLIMVARDSDTAIRSTGMGTPERPPLRFGIGARVVCNYHNPDEQQVRWTLGKVTLHWYTHPESDLRKPLTEYRATAGGVGLGAVVLCAPYQIKLDDGRFIYCPMDRDESIREVAVEPVRGCDLSAAGLLKTSDGKPKYVDFLDCTGGGDVDTCKTVTRDETDSTVTSISGRKLQLGAWADGAEEIRVGAVRLFSLLPGSVRARVKRERKAAFESVQHVAVTAAQRDLATMPAGPLRKDAEARLEQLNKLMDGFEDAGPLLDVVTCRVGADADDRSSWRVVVYSDEASSAADATSDATVDLSGATPMAPYRVAQEVGDLGYGTALSYCVQVYDGGDTTCVVVDSGSHGTHVAGIAAAHFEGMPERDGVAPGAQVLALKIGDGRLDAAETGTGLVRALIACKAAGADLINLSFGEPSWQPDSGRTAQTFTDAVRKWGMSVFTSAGNDGPALSTLGSPGDLTAPIVVGAFISPSMMIDQYSMLEPSPSAGDEPSGEVAIDPTSYSFSSRGPTPDGWLPTLCAPGGAIAPVPRHTLQGKAQYHGTSMSSPNACGVAACVISALRQRGVNVGPMELRRALENSATPVAQYDPFAQGFGLINAPAAVAYAMAHHGKLCQDVDIAVTLPSRNNARGLYLRDAAELAGPTTYGVQVKPLFEHASVRTEAELEALLNIELPLKLTASAPWVTTPASMVLTSGQERGGQSFAVRVDASGLAPGAHFARVFATDASDPERGPLFSLPVTVVVPHVVAPLSPTNLPIDAAASTEDDAPPIRLAMSLPPGAPNRKFLAVPDNAEWAAVKIITGAMPNGPHAVILHAVPSARGDVPNTHLQVKRMLALREHSEEVVNLPILKGGSTLELCMQLSWLANPNPVDVTAVVEWHSYNMRGNALVSDRPLRISSAQTFARLEVGAPLRAEKLSPKAELTAAERTLRPTKHNISAASAELDVLPPSDAQRVAEGDAAAGTQIHQMVLSYTFDVATDKDGDTVGVMPRVASLHEQLYDSPLDSTIWRLDSSAGAILGYGGLIHDASPVKLRKGQYTISLLMRHPSPAMLEALKDLPLMLRMDLPKGADCKVFAERGAASTAGHGAKTMGDMFLRRGAQRSVYVAAPTAALPAWVAPGDTLVGELLLDQAVGKASQVKLMYDAPPPASKKDDAAGKKDADDEEEDLPPSAKEAKAAADDVEALDKAILEAKLTRLAALRTSGASTARYTALSSELLDEHRAHLPLLLELLSWERGSNKGENGVEEVEDLPPSAKEAKVAADIGTAADALLAPDGPVDPTALAQYFGVAPEDQTDLSKAAKKEADELKKKMDEQRKALRVALYAKASSLAPTALELAAEPPADDAPPTPFVEAVREMRRWVTKPEDLDESERDGLALTLAKYELVHARGGAALAGLHARHKAVPTKTLFQELTRMYRALGWEHWAANAAERKEKDYPSAKTPL